MQKPLHKRSHWAFNSSSVETGKRCQKKNLNDRWIFLMHCMRTSFLSKFFHCHFFRFRFHSIYDQRRSRTNSTWQYGTYIPSSMVKQQVPAERRAQIISKIENFYELLRNDDTPRKTDRIYVTIVHFGIMPKISEQQDAGIYVHRTWLINRSESVRTKTTLTRGHINSWLWLTGDKNAWHSIRQHSPADVLHR